MYIETIEKTISKTPLGQRKTTQKGSLLALVSIGTLKHTCQKAIEELSDPDAWSHFDLIFIKLLDTSLLHLVFGEHKQVVVIEEGVRRGELLLH